MILVFSSIELRLFAHSLAFTRLPLGVFPTERAAKSGALWVNLTEQGTGHRLRVQLQGLDLDAARTRRLRELELLIEGEWSSKGGDHQLRFRSVLALSGGIDVTDSSEKGDIKLRSYFGAFGPIVQRWCGRSFEVAFLEVKGVGGHQHFVRFGEEEWTIEKARPPQSHAPSKTIQPSFEPQCFAFRADEIKKPSVLLQPVVCKHQ